MDEIGLRWRGSLPELGLGFFAGVGLITLVVIIQAIIGGYRITSFEGLSGVQGFCAAALAMLGVAIVEEVMFRAILFRIAEDVVGTMGAIIISALAFGFVHSSNNSASSFSSLFIALEAGLLLAAAFALTRQLWLAIGIHWGWNASLGSLWGLPVSGEQSIPTIFKAEISGSDFLTGGGFGPEAGMLALIVCTAAGTILLLLAQRRGLLFTPQWMQRVGGRTTEMLTPGRYVEWKRLRQQPPPEELASPLPIAESIG